MKRIIIVCCILLIAGCGQWMAIPARNFSSTTVTTEEPQSVVNSENICEKNYKIGETKTSFIGKEIIKIRSYRKDTTTIRTSTYTITKIASSSEPLYAEAQYKFSTYKISSGIALKNHSIERSISLDGKTYNMLYLPDNYGDRWGILVDDGGEIFKSGIYSYYHEMMYYPNAKVSVSPAKINVSLEKALNTNSENEPEVKVEMSIGHKYDIPYELVYSGKNNVSLNITYREYTSDLHARPAFYQNITYRADANNIRFKDFVIKVHSASNEKISYTVLEDGLKCDIVIPIQETVN